MSQQSQTRNVIGQIILWGFRAYCLFFIIEIIRVGLGVLQLKDTLGHDLAIDTGLAIGGMIVFVPLAIIGLLLFLLSRKFVPVKKAIKNS